MSLTSAPVTPCSCSEGWKPEGWSYCAECYEGQIERLQTENWQLRQACGYPIPADKETPQNLFKCGICDARRAG